MKGIDCFATIRPEWAPQLKALGYDFFARYYRRDLNGGRGNPVSRAEARACFDAGLWALAVFQHSADKPSYFTHANALADANAALAKAAEMDQPEGTAIYFAVDCNPAAEQLGAISEYFVRLVEVVKVAGGYTIGVYGSGLVCRTLLDRNHAECAWLANAAGWHGSRGFDDWTVKQSLPYTLPFGLEVDADEARGPEAAGMWRR